MRVLVLGGTGFIGPYVIRGLVADGHEVSVFHRGNRPSDLPGPVSQIRGDYRALASHETECRRCEPDVVLDMIATTEGDAHASVEVFRGIANRVVVLSSADVYRAYDVINRVEPGPLQPVPVSEDGELRRTLFPFRDSPNPSADRPPDYEKILVERVYRGEPKLRATILRLPIVYGPGDWRRHRTLPYVKRMDDGRQAILLEDGFAGWRVTRGYVENVAAAIAAAVVSERAAGRIYNVGETLALTEKEWVTSLGDVVGWDGDVVVLPDERVPEALRFQGNPAQHWVLDTSRISEELDFEEPVHFREALRRTVAWERLHMPEEPPAGMFDYEAEDLALAGWR
jgi:nucleoside-diphosphate-sugar epimerase